MSAVIGPAAPMVVATGTTALVLDSPHSGSHYPEDFRYACNLSRLRRAEDFLVDELFGFAPSLGAAFVAATFPRSYIDANRSLEDVDPLLLAPHERDAEVAPSVKSQHGMGLVWRLLDGREPIYAAHLAKSEIDARIERCWKPYHAAVDQAVETAFDRHGRVLHLNCHSMPSASRLYPAGHGHAMPFDFLLGDREGTTASPGVTEHLAEALRSCGYQVGVNGIFKGVELVRRHGRPAEGRHSVQIEVNRRLYMDEERLRLHDGFQQVRGDLETVLRSLRHIPWPAADRTAAS